MSRTRTLPQRLFWPVTALLLVYLCAVEVRSAMLESITGDEPVELAAGYTYLTTGDFRLNPEHPAFFKMAAALPLLWFHLAPVSDPTAWTRPEEFGYGTNWLAVNGRKRDKMLFDARLLAILFALGLGLVLAIWARSAFGPATALLALTLYAFDPTVGAHGHYIKTDISVTLFALLTCIAWNGYLKRPSGRGLLLTGAALGLALATKFSAVFLLPSLIALYAIARWQRVTPLPAFRGFVAIAAVVGVALVCIVPIYSIPAWVHHARLPGADFAAIHDLLARGDLAAATRPADGAMRAHPFLAGLALFFGQNTEHSIAYLFGMRETQGWYYFPVAFAVKMPTATLAILAFAAWVCLRKLSVAKLRKLPLEWFTMAVPVVVYAALAGASHINIGIRHLLPLWPFVFILAAAVFWNAGLRRAPLVCTALVAGLIAESVAIFPHYMAFFNVLCGGPANGPKILADSNIDWGQDAANLARWLKQHGKTHLCIDYWGNADLNRLGISGEPLNQFWQSEHRYPLCTAAVSVDFLYGMSPDRGDFTWLRSLEPDARVGYSIYVFDFAGQAHNPDSPYYRIDKPTFYAVQHQDLHGSPTSADPAVPGEILAFFLSGLGPVNPPVPPAHPAPLRPLSYTRLPVFCHWSSEAENVFADIRFAGLAPTQAGVYQVNLRVPKDPGKGEITCRSAIYSPSESQPARTVVPVSAAAAPPKQ